MDYKGNLKIVKAADVQVGDFAKVDDYTEYQIARINTFKCGDGETGYEYFSAEGHRIWLRESQSAIIRREQ